MRDVTKSPIIQMVSILEDEVVLLDAVGFIDDVILGLSIVGYNIRLSINADVNKGEIQSKEADKETAVNLDEFTNQLFKEEVITGDKENALYSIKQAIAIIGYKKYIKHLGKKDNIKIQ